MQELRVIRKKVIFAFLTILFASNLPNAQENSDALPDVYKKWLDEEVAYIITHTEKEVFLQLQTNQERDTFIKAFWHQRDKLHGMPEGEARKEHYRRINHANHYYGRSSLKPGWQTDRGRIYIILGEPNDIQRFEGKTQTYPAEIWFYQGKTDLGLPPGFNLVFFQEGGIGEYRFYSPARDGPQALLTSYYGDPIDFIGAYQMLAEFEPDLASVSLSLIPGEGDKNIGRPSLSSDILIQRVETTPVRQMKDRYAQKFLEYKDIVEVEYSTNYILSDSSVKVIRDPSGIYFAHYAFEPERLSVDSYDDKYFTTLKVNGIISNLENKIIYQFEKDFSFNFDEERIKRISRQPVSIRDMFPLIPGHYKLSILLKNEASKEFTSIERELYIPAEDNRLQMTSLILGYGLKKYETPSEGLRPFFMGNHQIYVHSNKTFVKSDTLVTAFQIHGFNRAVKEKGEIKYTFFKEGEKFQSTHKRLSEYTELPNILEQFPLQGFSPAHYRIQVSLWVDGKEILFDKEDFDVSYAAAMTRPWIYTKVLAEIEDPAYEFILGTQLYNSGRSKEAQDYFERAYQKDTNSIEFALGLAQVYLNAGRYEKIEPILLRFFNQSEPAPFEMFFILGKAYQNLGELAKAVNTYKETLSLYGLNIYLLNSLGECYFSLDDTDEALAAWEKSLEIDPNQIEIKKKIELLKKNRRSFIF
jgi:GWxTD domain-containing protein